MPIHSNGSDKYSTRLNMLVQSGKWMYDLFDKNNVDIIVNCGDMLDSHIVRAEEMTALSEFYNYSKGIPEYTLIGNHDTLDNSREFYSTSILNNMGFIHVLNEPCVLKIPYKDESIAFLPYMKSELINDSLLRELSNKSDILFSHIDIKGSHLRPDYIMDSGVSAELLSMNFKYVFNGHLHTAEKIPTSENYICNIGSFSSNSFSDNNSYIPSVLIFDTESKSIQRFEIPYAILFRKVTIHRISDLVEYINNLDNNYKYIVRTRVPYNIKDEVRKLIADSDKILSYRIVIDQSSSNQVLRSSEILSDDSDIKADFQKFISDNQDIIKYPLDVCNKIIKEIEV